MTFNAIDPAVAAGGGCKVEVRALAQCGKVLVAGDFPDADKADADPLHALRSFIRYICFLSAANGDIKRM
ncbi:hypothetical protein LRS12_00595 [Sphingomonas sp. J344]|uniref:hypothetical protein n=1 Tax=Sphingomonas sp. J344 TaxID=2898434 RepID=UPI002151BF3F|nr:hypothetical protein [Sphingomonas sp. J344]MCR5869389.1 hypothetical protein [Sphingomonas sp. J344]